MRDTQCLQAWIPPDTEPDLLRFRINNRKQGVSLNVTQNFPLLRPVLLLAFLALFYANAQAGSQDDKMIELVQHLNGNVVVQYEGEHGLGQQILEVHLPEIRITDEHLSKIGQIESLEAVEMSSDLFSIKTVPDEVIDWLQTLPDLKKLRIHGFIGSQGR